MPPVMDLRRSSRDLCLSSAGLLLLAALSACQTVPTKTYDIRQRAFTYQPGTLVQDYQEEYAYIEQRRNTVASGESNGVADHVPMVLQVPPHLTGLAFSGGGIRSATFHLGLLQSLHDMQRLPKIDYLSTVSGGSYVAGWMLAHLGQEQDDVYGNLVQTMDQGKLLDPHNDFVAHLRHHSGFIKEGGFWEGPKLMWGYMWRLIPYYMWDLILHIKTPPEIGNELHLFTPYEDRIQLTYLRGKHETPLVRLNRKDADAPYLIINGNLVNRGRPRAYEGESNRPYRDNYNFEFTRDYTGSDGLGYIQSAGFGLPVVEAQTEDGKPAWFNPRKVVVEDLTEGTCHKPRPERIRADACVRLSQAMTASGAGLDLDSLVEEWYRNDVARLLFRFGTAPFNINNEFQTWNYARRFNTPVTTVWDYFLMMTIQRIWPDTKSRWIEITDGSFYDNLGTQTLLRRQVSHIIVGDATLDTTWQYDYLHHLQARIKSYFGEGAQWCGEIPEQHEIVWYRRFWVLRPDGTPTVIHYLKPYAYNSTLFKKNPSLAAPGKIFVSADPESGRPLAEAPLASPPTNPTHLDGNRLLSMISDAQARERAQLAIKKVTKIVEAPEGKEFPQTSTVFQWYELEEFEAYRHLGYLMGWAYLSKLELSETELTPTTSCRTL
ncbi:MAG: patatin-like phospholipase family protein [Nitrospira sp.]|nr:patatin-like phospholipase family protein [Nitrospira sp.]